MLCLFLRSSEVSSTADTSSSEGDANDCFVERFFFPPLWFLFFLAVWNPEARVDARPSSPLGCSMAQWRGDLWSEPAFRCPWSSRRGLAHFFFRSGGRLLVIQGTVILDLEIKLEYI